MTQDRILLPPCPRLAQVIQTCTGMGGEGAGGQHVQATQGGPLPSALLFLRHPCPDPGEGFPRATLC